VKITSVETIVLRHPITIPQGPASVLNESRSCLLVAIHTDDGTTGWGEAVGFPGIRELIADGLAPRLIGKNPVELQRTWRNPWMVPY